MGVRVWVAVQVAVRVAVRVAGWGYGCVCHAHVCCPSLLSHPSGPFTITRFHSPVAEYVRVEPHHVTLSHFSIPLIIIIVIATHQSLSTSV